MTNYIILFSKFSDKSIIFGTEQIRFFCVIYIFLYASCESSRSDLRILDFSLDISLGESSSLAMLSQRLPNSSSSLYLKSVLCSMKHTL